MRRRTYVASCLVVGAALIIGGGVTTVRATDSEVPSYVDAALRSVQIEVWVSEPSYPLLVSGGFQDPSSMSVTISPVTLEDLLDYGAPSDVEEATVVVTVEVAEGEFGWEARAGLEAVESSPVGDGSVTTSRSEQQEGIGRFVLLKGRVTAENPILGFGLSVPGDLLSGSGRFRRLELPSISTQPLHAMGVGELSLGLGEHLTPGLSGGMVDGEVMHLPRLDTWVAATPYESFNPNLVAYRMWPEPTYSPPLTWQQSGRFIPDVVYEDLDWQHRSDVKIMLGGIAIGLGGAVVLLPIALIQPETPRRESPGRNRRVRRR